MLKIKPTNMKNNILALVSIFLLSSNLSTASNWLTSLEEAKKMVIATDKLILVDFWASWCGPCNRMDFESWGQADVKLLMDDYVPVRIDIDTNKSLAREYDVQGIPYVFILDGNGKIIYKQMSYKSKNDVMKLLTKYALSTQFLRQDLVNYYKNQNFSTSFRLASKYQDFGLYVTDKDVKFDILKLSSNYFSDSEKLLKSSDIAEKDAFKQKINLFEIQALLINKNTRKALKKLERIESSSIHQLNSSFYNFLYYTTYAIAGDTENSNLWKDKMSEFDIKKSQLFLNPVSSE